MPSVPTSRATRVTSSANDDSWSTIVFTVFFSSRISPCASTVIFCDRSPFATAVETWEMLRTWLVRLPASWLTFSVRSRHVPETPRTCAWPPSLPSMPTSRATRVTSSANDDSWSTIVFTVSFSSRISPWAATVIFCDRSPFATAVDTWAMLRTCAVRFDAIELTLSVRSFQVPATPGTSACPPSLPSVPTSRATRVTCSANSRSVSVSEFIVSASSATSPRAPTVIFCDRSPFATAVATWEIDRTCPVRFDAMVFTESVRSFQVPATPRTSACPPSLPSVPTSRATRVTSSANDDSWSTIVFTVRPMRRYSPRNGRPSISSAMCWDRSPSATATMTRAISVVGRPRSSMSELTARCPSAHEPSRPSSSRRSVSRPSRPTIRLIRRRSRCCRSCNDTTSLKASATSPGRPARRGRRTRRSPRPTRRNASTSSPRSTSWSDADGSAVTD